MTSSSPGLASPRHALDATATALMVLLCAVWGLNQVAIKVAVGGISPIFQAGLRSIGAGILVLAWVWLRGIPLGARDGTLVAGVAAGLLFAIEFVLIYVGFTYTTASRGVLFLYTTPFVVALGAHLFIPADRLTRRKTIGLLAAFCGLLVAFADGMRLPSWRELIGDSLCLGGAVLWGATIVLVKASPLARVSAEKTLLYQLGISALVLPPAALLVGEPGIFHPTPLVFAALAYQIAIVASASYVAFLWLMTRYPASHLSAFSFLTPVLGVVFGALLLGEPLTPALAVAVTLIAAGIYLVNRPAAH